MKKSLATLSALSTVAITFAQQGLNAPIIPPLPNGGTGGSGIGQNLRNIVLAFKDIATGVYSSLFVVALIMFFVGIIMYMRPGSGDDKKKAFEYLGFGVVALFVMVGIWGLVSFLSASLGIGIGGDIPVPSAPTSIQVR
jgi:hypothetical protein